MWYGHIRDLFPTAEDCKGSRLPNVTKLHWAYVTPVKFLVCGFSFFFDFFNDLLASCFRAQASLTQFFFVSLIPSGILCIVGLVFFDLTRAILLWNSDHECCHDTSVVTAHVDHVVGFGIFVVFRVSSLHYDVVDFFL